MMTMTRRFFTAAGFAALLVQPQRAAAQVSDEIYDRFFASKPQELKRLIDQLNLRDDVTTLIVVNDGSAVQAIGGFLQRGQEVNPKSIEQLRYLLAAAQSDDKNDPSKAVAQLVQAMIEGESRQTVKGQPVVQNKDEGSIAADCARLYGALEQLLRVVADTLPGQASNGVNQRRKAAIAVQLYKDSPNEGLEYPAAQRGLMYALHAEKLLHALPIARPAPTVPAPR